MRLGWLGCILNGGLRGQILIIDVIGCGRSFEGILFFLSEAGSKATRIIGLRRLDLTH